MKKGTLTTARTYTDGQVFHIEDADTHFPHNDSKTRMSDLHYLKTHGITDTCPSMKVYNITDELRVNVHDQSKDNVKLMMSCHCK